MYVEVPLAETRAGGAVAVYSKSLAVSMAPLLKASPSNSTSASTGTSPGPVMLPVTLIGGGSGRIRQRGRQLCGGDALDQEDRGRKHVPIAGLQDERCIGERIDTAERQELKPRHRGS